MIGTYCILCLFQNSVYPCISYFSAFFLAWLWFSRHNTWVLNNPCTLLHKNTGIRAVWNHHKDLSLAAFQPEAITESMWYLFVFNHLWFRLLKWSVLVLIKHSRGVSCWKKQTYHCLVIKWEEKVNSSQIFLTKVMQDGVKRLCFWPK